MHANWGVLCLFFAVLGTAASGPLAAYRIDSDGRDFVASNAGQQLSVRFHDGRADFAHPGGRFSLSLAGVPAASRAELRGNRLEFTRGPIAEWFVNDAGGIEQGFTIAAKLSGGRLELTLECGGDMLPAVEGSSVLLRRDGRTILRYAALHSWDADGRALPSRVEVVGRRIQLLVDDAGARYPVTVDPVVQQAILSPVGSAASAGRAVAIGDDVAVVAGDQEVFVYWRVKGGWSSGIRLRTDSIPITYSVAAGDGIIAVSLPEMRQVIAYTGSGDTWTAGTPISVLSPIASGTSLAISGNTLVVGALVKGLESSTGNAMVYVQDKAGWTRQVSLGIPNFDDPSFGASVALDGDTLIIGAPRRNNGSGAVFVFHRAGTVWSPQGCTCNVGSGMGVNPEIDSPAGSQAFGSSVALDGDTAVIGALPVGDGPTGQAGSAFVFGRSSLVWSQQAQLVAPVTVGFPTAVAVRGDIAVLTVAPSTTPGRALVFSRIDAGWALETEIDGSADLFGFGVGMLGDTLLLGSPGENLSYVYQLSNVTLTSSPSGRGFTLSGSGCGTAGSYITPYTGLWSACTVQWTSPDTATPGTRYTFQNWSDGNFPNPRSLTLSAATLQAPYAFNASFLTEYQLSTQAVPASGGTVTGSGWYAAGSTAVAAAVPNAGFLFTGFSGALSGFTTPSTVLMNGPQSVTGGFSATPPAVLAGIISTKSGAAANRQWTISLTNGGPGTAYNAQLFLITFAQTFGSACTAPPVPLAPVALPVSLGTLAPGATVQTAARFDFTGCPANARFTVNIGYMSNGGWSGGVIQLVNQVY